MVATLDFWSTQKIITFVMQWLLKYILEKKNFGRLPSQRSKTFLVDFGIYLVENIFLRTFLTVFLVKETNLFSNGLKKS